MAVTDYSTTPASNTAISGINIAEGCPAGNMNGAVRQVMADIRVMYNGLPVTSGLAPKAAAVFEGTRPIYTGQGSVLNWNASGFTSGRIFLQPSGGAIPSMTTGDILLEY